MLVKCLHYSVTYPTGGQNIGDIFDLAKAQADYYEKMGWVKILPQELQPKVKRGKRKVEFIVSDLSKSAQNGRHMEHFFYHNEIKRGL